MYQTNGSRAQSPDGSTFCVEQNSRILGPGYQCQRLGAAQVKLPESFGLPLPLYFAT